LLYFDTFYSYPKIFQENILPNKVYALSKASNYLYYGPFVMVLYGCETWSLTLRQEHRLRVFENRVLRRIFGPKRDEVTGKW
jgi:hypothetical protein